MNLSLAQTQKQATSDASEQIANQIVKGSGKVGNAMRGGDNITLYPTSGSVQSQSINGYSGGKSFL